MMIDDKYNKPQRVTALQRRRASTIVLLSIVTLWLLLSGKSDTRNPANHHLLDGQTRSLSSSKLKLLYIVTTLNEYDNGRRRTKKGFDRLKETLIPVVSESVESMLSFGFDVDVVLICHFNMTREQLVKDALPRSVGLEVWDEATPLGYKLEDKNNPNSTQAVTRALARQHRFVIKDKFENYDFFINFEDDMLIKGEAVQNYIELTEELYRLRELAPEVAPNEQFLADKFYGVMTKSQLQRMIPGFIRVEVLLEESKFGAQKELDPVPIIDRPQIDPNPCCLISNPLSASDSRPQEPSSDKLILWETNIKPLGVRKLPVQSKIDWVVLQRGPHVEDETLGIRDYWSGRDHYYEIFPEKKDRIRPPNSKFQYVNNQGGWMATRQQIFEWHTEICPGGFLPPFDPGDFNLDGLDMRNVEYWSGGMHIFTSKHACNLQRIIPLEPDKFARHLLYHTANNKQRQLNDGGKQQMLVKVNDLLGELNTVRTNAQAEMHRRINAMNDVLHQV